MKRFFLLAAVLIIPLGGCSDWFKFSSEVGSGKQMTVDQYKIERDKLEQKAKEESQAALLKAKDEMDQKTAVLEVKRRLETEAVTAAQEAQIAAIEDAQAQHAQVIAAADVELQAKLRRAGRSFSQQTAASRSNIAAAESATSLEISRINSEAGRTAQSILDTAAGSIRRGDQAYASTQATIEKWQGAGDFAVSNGLPLLATAGLGTGAVGLLTSAWMFFRKKKAESGLDAVTHGNEQAKKMGENILLTSVPNAKSVADVVRWVNKNFIQGQATPMDDLTIAKSVKRA